ncbi:PP2C family protein-serine/threonine phosphatase [Halalkalibacter nanhaiisediminis]|uniref:Sigma-B regulation protein RsbU (Phosphoserine phosphatase) n=1 Tax=Halalkalibacter nanhaiisediminis TaxID=688079 RepID=A0A562QBE3_9BACI|nr:PP2C family protein-serine/threonine phosphatase [Halalkalibacter nanhaiisediminis]TWI54033.1 sigma-B regulation protein RsbU (phosphoserine phosphatase) [Halalkalibacter nanhaiisediminis]
MKETVQNLEESYKDILKTFLNRKSEQGLYKAQQFSKILLEHQISPEELVSVHRAVLEELYPSVQEEVLDSFDLLLEVMMGYGLAYREHQSLRDRQLELESEIDVAANMQQTLLPEVVPNVESLDIGVISVPANKMSGDYYNYIQDDRGCIGLAIADIIGKGVPAALCMSMIKYAMDSLPEQRLQPGQLLESLNRVVEHNVDDSMFITMMYGSYDPHTHEFRYSGAGHEPGFFYNAKADQFHELYAKGLVLGVSRKTKFREYHMQVNAGDFIIFLSDGVTECRIGDDFIEREEIIQLIRKYMHLSAQRLVESVYHELAKLQGFQLKDDFTLMILRRNV